MSGNILDEFFGRLEDFGRFQQEFIGAAPTRVHINPLLLRKLSREPGFFQRPELRAEVTSFSPIVSRITFQWGVVEIREDAGEVFAHFE